MLHMLLLDVDDKFFPGPDPFPQHQQWSLLWFLLCVLAVSRCCDVRMMFAVCVRCVYSFCAFTVCVYCRRSLWRAL